MLEVTGGLNEHLGAIRVDQRVYGRRAENQAVC